MAVVAFLQTHSTTCAVILEDVGEWRRFLPPPFSADVPGTEADIRTLQALHAAPNLTCRALFCMLDAPLFGPLFSVSAADVARLRGLAEWLQLPAVITERLDLHADVLRFRATRWVVASAASKTLPLKTQMASWLYCGAPRGMPPALEAQWSSTIATWFPMFKSNVSFHLGLLGVSDGGTNANVCGLAAARRPLQDAHIARLMQWPSPSLFDAACGAIATGGNLMVLSSLRARDPERQWGVFAMAGAARTGNLELVKWLHAHACPSAEMTYMVAECEFAAKSGHLPVLQWLHANGCRCNSWTCVAAAEGGHLDVLEWLRAQGCPCDANACARAARHGRLAVLQWMRAHDCPWDVSVCAAAAKGGHLPILQWLRAHGCPWDERTCEHAITSRHWDMLRWLRKQDPPCPWWPEAWVRAAAWGDMRLLEWLRDEGCPWHAGACAAAARMNLWDVVRWLRAHGCPCDSGTACLAAAHSC